MIHQWDFWVVSMFVAIALLAPFLSGKTPILCADTQGVSIPLLGIGSHREGITGPCTNQWHLLPVLAYDARDIDRQSLAVPPGSPGNVASWRYRHWLGTDGLGRDIAAGLIHGTAVAMIIGLLSVALAFMLGTTLGMWAAYSRYTKPKASILQLILAFTGVFLIWFYTLADWSMTDDSFGYGLIGGLACFAWISVCFSAIDRWTGRKTIPIPLDGLLVKCIEIRKSIPGLLLLLAFTGILSTPSKWTLSLLIALLTFTEFARYSRAETLAAMEENYVKSLHMLGLPMSVILRKHILPNSLPTLTGVAVFSIAGAILLESSLSFLGIGLPVEQVSWGKMLAEGRDLRHWWLVVFPGFLLFLLITGFHKSAERSLHQDDTPQL